jgi:uncharacterized membrane protein YfcA
MSAGEFLLDLGAFPWLVLFGLIVGAQIGASYTRKAGGPWVRFGLGCLIFVAVIMVVIKLWVQIAHG